MEPEFDLGDAKYLEFAMRLAKEAEEVALKYFSFEVETIYKEDSTPLTKADTEINSLVIEKIHQQFPEHSIYGEEESLVKPGSNYIWVCDPIDGTMAFSCGLPIFVFSIALVDQSSGLPVLGVINDPVMKTMYWAVKGSGAFRNGQQIYVSKETSFKKTYLSFGGSGRSIGFSYLPFIEKLSEVGCTIFKYPSYIYGGIQVANGMHIGGVLFSGHGHDVAALKIIAEEAGGKVTDLNGEERRYDADGLGCIVSNGILHNELLEIVQTCKV